MLVHDFIQTTKGPEVLRSLIVGINKIEFFILFLDFVQLFCSFVETLRNKQEKKLNAIAKAEARF